MAVQCCLLAAQLASARLAQQHRDWRQPAPVTFRAVAFHHLAAHLAGNAGAIGWMGLLQRGRSIGWQWRSWRSGPGARLAIAEAGRVLLGIVAHAVLLVAFCWRPDVMSVATWVV